MKKVKMIIPYKARSIEVKMSKNELNQTCMRISYNDGMRVVKIYEPVKQYFANLISIKERVKSCFSCVQISQISLEDEFLKQKLSYKIQKKIRKRIIKCIKNQKHMKDILVQNCDFCAVPKERNYFTEFREYNSRNAEYEVRVLYLAYLIKEGYITWDYLLNENVRNFLIPNEFDWYVLDTKPYEVIVEIESESF